MTTRPADHAQLEALVIQEVERRVGHRRGLHGHGGLHVLHLLGLSVLKKERQLAGKNVLEKAFSVMIPAGIGGLGVSKMSFAGPLMLRKMMKDKDVASVEELFAMAREMTETDESGREIYVHYLARLS
jgi:hypothetical protein